MGEKTWAERFPEYTPGFPKRGFDPTEFVESLRKKTRKPYLDMIRSNMSPEELAQEAVSVWGDLDSTFSQEANGGHVLLKPAEGRAPGGQVRILAIGPKEQAALKYYLNRRVIISGWLASAPETQTDGSAEVSFLMIELAECPPYEIWKEWEENPTGKPRNEELRVDLAYKIVKNGKIKVAVIGPEKNGIDLFRKEFEALALKDSNLKKCIDWRPIPLPLMPRGYTVSSTNKFYTELGKKLEKIADSPEKFDVLCLVRGGGELKDITRLNNVPLWKATTNIPVPICSALGECDYTLWLMHLTDDRALSPSGLAHWLKQLVDLAQEMLKSGSPTVSKPSRTSRKTAGASMMGAKPSAKVPKTAAKPKATATAKTTPTKTAAPKAKPAASSANKPTKASAAKTATAVAATTRKTPKTTKPATPKTPRKTVAKTTKARTTKASAVAKPKEPPKASKTNIIVLILLLILVLVAAVAAYLDKYA